MAQDRFRASNFLFFAFLRESLFSDSPDPTFGGKFQISLVSLELRFGENLFYPLDDLGRLGDCSDHLFLQLLSAEVGRAVPVQQFFCFGGKLGIL
jgi:hypothetical protein